MKKMTNKETKKDNDKTKQNIDKQNKVNDTNRPDAFFPFA